MTPSAHGVTYREAAVADVPAIHISRGADPEWGPADRRTAAYLEGTHHPQHALAARVAFVALRRRHPSSAISRAISRRDTTVTESCSTCGSRPTIGGVALRRVCSARWLGGS